jgi:hypothetical protein
VDYLGKEKEVLIQIFIPMETEIAVEHPKFDGYSYKFKLL